MPLEIAFRDAGQKSGEGEKKDDFAAKFGHEAGRMIEAALSCVAGRFHKTAKYG